MLTRQGVGAWSLALLACAGAASASDLRLIEAVKSRDKAAVERLLKQGAPVNAVQPDGATALHWAVYREDAEATDLLIRSGANVNAKNELGATPLWLAATLPSPAIAERLLTAGANPNAALDLGETPLMAAARAGAVTVVRLILKRGADVESRDRSRGQTALMWAVAERHPEVVRALVEYKADPNARSNSWSQPIYAGLTRNASPSVEPETLREEAQGGFTPLLFAARNGDSDCAKLLLAAGANINDAAANGASALVVAAMSGHGALARFLLEKGADPNAAAAGYTALHAAILRADVDLIQSLLARGADPNVRLSKATPARRHSQDWAMNLAWVSATPYWLAARFAEPKIMRILVVNAADPKLTLENGVTPLMAAVSGAPMRDFDRRVRNANTFDKRLDERLGLEAAKLAIELGADVNGADEAGNTALHIAATNKLNATVQFLVDRGAKVDAKNKRGETPLALASIPSRGGQQAGDESGQSTAELLRKLTAAK